MATTTAAGSPARTATSSRPTGLTILTVFTALMLLVATYMTFFYAGMEQQMGNVQRIFYFHVGAAWAGALGFIVVVIAGIAYLRTGARKWDIIGHASVEVGLALITITLISGPIWAKPVWNTYWNWDPKLTAAAVMWLTYAAYLMLRQGIEDPARRGRFSAVYGIVAFASVIMTYVGVRFLPAVTHPVVVGPSADVADTSMRMSDAMRHTMIFSFITFTFVFFTLMLHRARLERLSDRVNLLKSRLMGR